MSEPATDGEALERASRMRWIGLIVASGAIGGVGALLIMFQTAGETGPYQRPVPVWLAALCTIIWLALLAYSTWYYYKRVDEVERQANYFGYAVGGGLLFLLYPIWYLFWWAGVLPEPSHEALMGLLLVAALAGYAWKKYC